VAKTKRATQATNGKKKARPTREPSPQDLIRQPDITAPATMRFRCQLFVKVTHPEYMAHEVMALVRQGQVELDPLAPGQVGTLILNGFPYTVVGYYTFSEQDAEYEEVPRECAFHGLFYDFYRDEGAMLQDMVNTSGEDFEMARQRTRELQENMARTQAQRQKRRRQRQKAGKPRHLRG
jgi:hypothetical protein